MTGKGMGPCGRGSGIRKGFGRRFSTPALMNLTEVEEKKILEAEKTEIEKRLKELKTK